MVNILFFLSLCLSSSIFEAEIHQSFIDFVNTHKSEPYSSDDELQHRYKIFSENYKYIKEINSQNLGYTLGVNQFADLTNEEFKSKFFPISLPKTQASPSKKPFKVDLPKSEDWVKSGGVTPVVNQGVTVNPIPIVVAKTVETLHFIYEGELVPLSWQQIIDCIGPRTDLNSTYEYVSYASGLMNETTYPNIGEKGKCRFVRSEVTGEVSGYNGTDSGNQSDLELALLGATLAVTVDASSSVWQFYQGGIIEKRCGTTVDHVVLLVGFGEEDGTEFWKIENSWGTSWGEEGYARLLRNGNTAAEGECGIATSPYYPFRSL